jgi:hypothetical protein
MLILNYTACVPVLLAVGMFSLYHFWSLAANTTTIEGWEKDKVAILKRKGKIEEVRSLAFSSSSNGRPDCSLSQYRYPYHLGYIANVQSVLGRNPVFWCWPRKDVPGDGLHYPVEAGLGKPLRERWRPRKAKESDWEDTTTGESESDIDEDLEG